MMASEFFRKGWIHGCYFGKFVCEKKKTFLGGKTVIMLHIASVCVFPLSYLNISMFLAPPTGWVQLHDISHTRLYIYVCLSGYIDVCE